jgi:hypothetical protein
MAFDPSENDLVYSKATSTLSPISPTLVTNLLNSWEAFPSPALHGIFAIDDVSLSIQIQLLFGCHGNWPPGAVVARVESLRFTSGNNSRSLMMEQWDWPAFHYMTLCPNLRSEMPLASDARLPPT